LKKKPKPRQDNGEKGCSKESGKNRGNKAQKKGPGTKPNVKKTKKAQK